MKCAGCGFENDEHEKFCTNCGAKLPDLSADAGKDSAAEPKPNYISQTSPKPNYISQTSPKPVYYHPDPQQNAPLNIPVEYKPLSSWGFFIWRLLFGLPVIGFILLIIFSVGGIKNKSLRNYAVSHWIWALFVLIIMIAGLVFLVMNGGTPFLQNIWKILNHIKV